MKAKRSVKQSGKGRSRASTAKTARVRRASTGSTPSPGSTTSSAEQKDYSGEIEVRLPLDVIAKLQQIALLADCSVQDIVRIAVATEVVSYRQRPEYKDGGQ